MADSLVLSAGRPVVVWPYIGDYSGFGSRIMIAWNASRESVRAVHDAMVFLCRAEQVYVCAVNPTDPSHIPGADIATHLARHGVKTEARHIAAPSGLCKVTLTFDSPRRPANSAGMTRVSLNTIRSPGRNRPANSPTVRSIGPPWASSSRALSRGAAGRCAISSRGRSKSKSAVFITAPSTMASAVAQIDRVAGRRHKAP